MDVRQTELRQHRELMTALFHKVWQHITAAVLISLVVSKGRFWVISLVVQNVSSGPFTMQLINIHEPVYLSYRPSPLRYTTQVRNFQ